MCNDYGNRIRYSAYLEAFSHLKIRLFAPGGAPNLDRGDDIWPTDVAPSIRANEDGAELIQLRWGCPSGRPKGERPVARTSPTGAAPRGCTIERFAQTIKRSGSQNWLISGCAILEVS
jgi:hypothetical protein